MSYGQLVSIESSFELDTSNLDQRLDEMQQNIDELDGLSEDKVQDLIDTSIDGRNLVSRDDVDIDNMETRVGDIDGLEERIEALESAEATSDTAVLEEHQKVMDLIVERMEKLEASRSRDSSVIDILRQLARALIG